MTEEQVIILWNQGISIEIPMPENATKIVLVLKTDKHGTLYQWHGNDGWSYSPVLHSQWEAENWPQKTGLKRRAKLDF
jgi:hypothetical protein